MTMKVGTGRIDAVKPTSQPVAPTRTGAPRRATLEQPAAADGFTPARGAEAVAGTPGGAHGADPVATWVTDTFRSMLNRAPTAAELQKTVTLIETLVAGGQHIFAAGAEVVGRIKDSAEYKGLHPLGEYFERSYLSHVGRPPTMEEIKQGEAFLQELTAQGKNFFEALAVQTFCLKLGDESKAWRAAHPLGEWTQGVFFDHLGRGATPEELANAEKIFQDAGNIFVGGAFVQGVVRQSPEFAERVPHGRWLDGLYHAELGRPATFEELRRGNELVQKALDEGKSPAEAQDVAVFCLRLSPEWQARHNGSGLRAQVAEWAVAQANAPNVGYSKTKGRFGDRTDANGLRYYDCSGLVFSAYKQFGIELGGNWTGAMRSTWRNWADEVPKHVAELQPGDLLLMDGHVVMYAGNGRCVGAQTANTAFQHQVRADIDVNAYLGRSDCIVLRPRV